MLFGEIVDGKMSLNRRGEIVQEEWFASTDIRKEIRLYPEEFVVMPNHIHGIVWIVDIAIGGTAGIVGAEGRDVPLRADGRDVPLRAQGRDVPLRAQGWDVPLRADGRDVPLPAQGRDVPLRADGRPPVQRKPRSLGSFIAGFKSSVTKRIREELNETGIWHRNYYEHIVRDDRELDAIRKYIETNPMRWAEEGRKPKQGIYRGG
jgi:REP element-mobilizing transposase RayT